MGAPSLAMRCLLWCSVALKLCFSTLKQTIAAIWMSNVQTCPSPNPVPKQTKGIFQVAGEWKPQASVNKYGAKCGNTLEELSADPLRVNVEVSGVTVGWPWTVTGNLV